MAEFNLKPDANGKVTVTLPGLENYSTLLAIAVNPHAVAQAVAPLPRKTLPRRELTLQQPLQPDRGYTEVRHARALRKHDSHIIDDITSTELSLVDSLETLIHALKELARMGGVSTPGLDEMSFVRGWDRLKREDKLSKFAAFGCHELNLFLKLKDPSFFKEIVRDFLLNKMEKSFIDHWLLDDAPQLRHFADSLPLLETLNPLELTLLAAFLAKDGNPERAQAIAGRLFRAARPLPVAQANKCFDCILRLHELKKPEEDGKLH